MFYVLRPVNPILYHWPQLSILARHTLPLPEHHTSVFTYLYHMTSRGASGCVRLFPMIPRTPGPFDLHTALEIKYKPQTLSCLSKSTAGQRLPPCPGLYRRFSLCSHTSCHLPFLALALLPELFVISLPSCLIIHNNVSVTTLFGTHFLLIILDFLQYTFST